MEEPLVRTIRPVRCTASVSVIHNPSVTYRSYLLKVLHITILQIIAPGIVYRVTFISPISKEAFFENPANYKDDK